MSRPPAYQPQSGPPPRAVPYEVSGQSISGGFVQPVTDVIDVYVMADLNVQDPEPLPTLGNDSNNGLSKDAPLLSMDGVRKLIARRGIAGKRIRVNLAGGGWPDVADPWDGQPTNVLFYLVRDLFAGGSEAFANSWCVRGPRKMFLRGTQPTITNFGGDGLRTKFQTTGLDFPTNGLRGSFLRIVRDGREVTQPVQITGNDSTYFWADIGPNTPGSVYALTDEYTIVDPAAELVPTNGFIDDVAGADGVSLQGLGAHDVYARPTNGVNPQLTFERIAMENLRLSNAAGISFDVVRFYNTFEIRGGWAEFHGCAANCQGGIDLNCEGRVAGSNSETNEYNGRALVADVDNPPPTSPTADPIWPARGGAGLYVAVGGLRIGGPHARGILRIWKGLSVEGRVTVRGLGSALVQPVGLNVLFIRSDDVGLHCVDGGQATIDDASGLVEIAAADGALRVGRGAAIALGTGAGAFREVGGWAGNFSRHLEVNGGGKPTGDFSRICDSGAWMSP